MPIRRRNIEEGPRKLWVASPHHERNIRQEAVSWDEHDHIIINIIITTDTIIHHHHRSRKRRTEKIPWNIGCTTVVDRLPRLSAHEKVPGHEGHRGKFRRLHGYLTLHVQVVNGHFAQRILIGTPVVGQCIGQDTSTCTSAHTRASEGREVKGYEGNR